MTEDVPPARQCTMPTCSNEKRDPTEQAGLCPDHAPDTDTDDTELNQQNTPDTGDVLVNDDPTEEEGGSPDETPTPDADNSGATPAETGEYAEIDFVDIESDTYPPALADTGQWMVRGDDLPPYERPKAPFAPWSDADGAKWGQKRNRADFEPARKWVDTDPRSDGLAFIQTDTDPFVFVDGDDVRDPETDDVHPVFLALLDRLGLTYTDISTSGAGVHAYYTGEIPVDGQGQAVFEIDTEPWGANDDVPTVEIYANKHVCVTTGDHVAGTPLEVTEWDETELEAILDEYDARKEQVSHDTDRDRADLKEYDPTATTTDETTEEIRDILKAVDQLRPADLRLRTSKVGTDSTGWEQWDPSSYRTTSGNDSLHRPPGEAVFHDHKHGEAFGVLSLVAAEEGILSKPWDRLAGKEWWDAVETAREQGADIPEYVGGKAGDAEQVAVLPPAVRDLSTATSGWDWRHTATEGERSLSKADAQERTVSAIADAYEKGDRVLIKALPTMGKSYGAILAAARTGEQITVLTGRGQKEQYAQFKDWAAEFGLSYYQLPSFKHDCPTAAGDHGEDWAEKVDGWYSRGATPQIIHKFAEDLLGRPLPCQVDGDGNHTDCPYASKWDFDPDEYDVLIGHYTHAYKPKVTTGRVAVLDEFPDAYETKLDSGLQGAVSYWLECTEGVPFEDYTDLLENRDDQQRRADALLWFEDHGIEPDETHVLDDGKAHASAPLAVFTILASDDLGNGFEKTDLGDSGTGVRDRKTDEIHLLQPPALDYASGVVGLDGTPTKRMWELCLGGRVNHREILQAEERAEYIKDALNLNLIRTTEYVKPYNSADHVNTEQDAALLEKIAENHGQKPSVITTSTAEHEYDAEGMLDLVDETKHYGNVLGSNEFKEKRLGTLIGSNHYGDGYIAKWGAYAGEYVPTGDEARENGEKGTDLSYGSFGDDVLTHMREHETLQAAMRFGRDGNGAVVYVHTNTLPDWVPLAGEGRVVSTWSDGMKEILRALEDLESATTAEIVDHPEVSVGRRQAFDHLETLRERGVLGREQDRDDGRKVRWVGDGLHRVNEHGDVDLDPVELEELDTEEVQELARSSNYTWEFRNSGGGGAGLTEQLGETSSTTSAEATSGGDRPPNDAD